MAILLNITNQYAVNRTNMIRIDTTINYFFYKHFNKAKSNKCYNSTTVVIMDERTLTIFLKTFFMRPFLLTSK